MGEPGRKMRPRAAASSTAITSPAALASVAGTPSCSNVDASAPGLRAFSRAAHRRVDPASAATTVASAATLGVLSSAEANGNHLLRAVLVTRVDHPDHVLA